MDVMLIAYLVGVIGGLFGLWFSGDAVVSNAILVAHRFNVSTFFLGFVVLAIAADIPELAITISSALAGVSEVAIGDIIGGNFSDVTMVVGSALLIAGNKIRMSAADNKKLLGILFLTSLIMFTLLCLGNITALHGLVLLAVYAAVIVYFWKHKEMRDLVHGEEEILPADCLRCVQKSCSSCCKKAKKPHCPYSTSLLLLKLAVSLGAVMVASHVTVTYALALSEGLSLPLETVGATILGIGTTLPELALCFGALRRGDFGLAIGPTLGTVLGQTTLILGLLAVLSNKPVQLAGLHWACMFMFLAFGVLAFGLMKRRPMGRGTGAALVSLFIAYLAYQVVL
ncbi:sodium:calcium antiporter [Candidatus Dependentiae bacterium]|nr:sodium:calcium antiporter [Candidatus Dependentiae bacterium]